MTIDQKYPKSIKKQIKTSTEKFNWGNIDVVDIVPEGNVDECPILFAPGWSITIDTIQNTLTFLADYGKRIISLNHKRVGGVKRDSEELRKASSILAILNRKNIELVDAVGYSEGCTNLLLAARLDPDKFRNIVLINPSGLVGKGKKMSIVKGFLVDLWGIKECKNGHKKRRKVFKESLKYTLSNPIRSYQEVNEIAQIELVDLIKGISETGIRVSIIHNINDQTFDFAQVNETLERAKNIHIEEFYAVGGGHFGLIKFPQKYMHIVAHALKNLKK